MVDKSEILMYVKYSFLALLVGLFAKGTLDVRKARCGEVVFNSYAPLGIVLLVYFALGAANDFVFRKEKKDAQKKAGKKDKKAKKAKKNEVKAMEATLAAAGPIEAAAA
tara:strand:- start:4314 stop:4640 length:327 start_codon:yes stop_codon:yes gene_type:complete